MIKSKDDLSLYLKADKQVYGIIGDENWKFQIALRMEEYHANQSGIYHRIMKKIWYLIHRHYGIKMGWDIPIIADGCAIGANSVVNKSFEEKGISIAGIPAKKVSNIGNKWIKTI